jgi:uncharacterized protein YcfL
MRKIVVFIVLFMWVGGCASSQQKSVSSPPPSSIQENDATQVEIENRVEEIKSKQGSRLRLRSLLR